MQLWCVRSRLHLITQRCGHSSLIMQRKETSLKSDVAGAVQDLIRVMRPVNFPENDIYTFMDFVNSL